MKIENKTRWRTEDIRFIVGQCLQEYGSDIKSKHLEVQVGVARERGGGGWFRRGNFVGGPPRHIIHVNITSVPREGFDPSSLEHAERVIDFTRGIMNCLGLRNGALIRNDQPVRWLADWYEVRLSAKGKLADCPVSPLMLEEAPAKVTDAEKYAHACVMLAWATTRLKRAETSVKRWQRRVNYYGKKAGGA